MAQVFSDDFGDNNIEDPSILFGVQVPVEGAAATKLAEEVVAAELLRRDGFSGSGDIAQFRGILRGLGGLLGS